MSSTVRVSNCGRDSVATEFKCWFSLLHRCSLICRRDELEFNWNPPPVLVLSTTTNKPPPTGALRFLSTAPNRPPPPVEAVFWVLPNKPPPDAGLVVVVLPNNPPPAAAPVFWAPPAPPDHRQWPVWQRRIGRPAPKQPATCWFRRGIIGRPAPKQPATCWFGSGIIGRPAPKQPATCWFRRSLFVPPPNKPPPAVLVAPPPPKVHRWYYLAWPHLRRGHLHSQLISQHLPAKVKCQWSVRGSTCTGWRSV